MKKGLVDTNTAALRERIDLNKKSDHNLEDWIVQQSSIESGMSILDLGCGTGKQIKAINRTFDVNIVGIDVSPEGLDFAGSKTTLICGSFDDNIIYGSFDRILSTYAIYYSQNMMDTITRYLKMLETNGEMFIVGAGNKTNQEVYSIVNSLIDEKGLDVPHRETHDFIGITDINSLTGEVMRLENRIHFDNKEDVMKWWSNHNSYIAELHEDLKKRLPEEGLSLTKNVLGVTISV
tara:strand:- start:2623 stop:3327 length:705 start_codon:yes stop_codon:yes gene_type:complete